METFHAGKKNEKLWGNWKASKIGLARTLGEVVENLHKL